MICEGFVQKTEEKKKKRKKERKNNLKSWDFEGTIEFNYLIETSKAFFFPHGDSGSYCLSVLKNEMPYIKAFSCY